MPPKKEQGKGKSEKVLLLYPLNKKQQFPLKIFDATNLNISETCFKTQCSKVDVTVKQNE